MALPYPNSPSVSLTIDDFITQTKANQDYLDGIVANFDAFSSLATQNIAASDSVDISGVGFQPDYILFFGAEPATDAMTWGFSDISTNMCIKRDYNDDTDQYDCAMYFGTASGKGSSVNVTSVNTDGFSLAFELDGAPAGTVEYVYICLKASI